MSDWWLGLGTAQSVVDCGGSQHRLLWKSGSLRAPEHEDPEGERTLAALGGTRNACVDVLDAWARHSDDLDVLLLASRGPGDQLVGDDPAMRAHLAMMQASTGGGVRPGLPEDPRDELISLLRLGGGLPERLVATVAAKWSRPSESLDDAELRTRARLHAALYGRVLSALRIWLGQPTLALDLRLIDADDERSLARNGDTVYARLPFAWIGEVWARDFATIWSRFSLAAETDREGRWTLRTIGPDFGATQLLRLELPSTESEPSNFHA